jgi:carboxymethylenebutenolidase
MLIDENYVDLKTSAGKMRTFLFQPKYEGEFPCIILYSEIYQVTGPIQRIARQLASFGYIVAAPEIYHEFEPLGSPFAYDTEGTDKGNRLKIEKKLSQYDEDADVVVQYLRQSKNSNGRVGTIGVCLGGHLSFRAAMNPHVQAGVCLYATDIHTATLGKGLADDSLVRMSDINGEMLMIWGKQDPHTDQQGRELIYQSMLAAQLNFSWHEFNAEHAFMRDEGPRYNAVLSSICIDLALELFNRKLMLSEPAGVMNSGKTNSQC